MISTILYSLWLPILVVVVSGFRFGFQGLVPGPDLNTYLTLFALAWPAAIPLTLAVRLLHRRSKVLAYPCGLVLGAASYFTVVLGGLFGASGVIACTIVASLPAWILLGIVVLVQRGKGSAAFGR